MNNNYHTQLDKSNNMLNEIAANSNLLQQQMQNFPGTPINKGTQTAQANLQLNPQLAQLTPQQLQQQLAYTQQQLAQAQQAALYQQQLNNSAQFSTQTHAKDAYAKDAYQALPPDIDEIELSEAKPLPTYKNVPEEQPQQSSQQAQQMQQSQPAIKNHPTKTQAEVVEQPNNEPKHPLARPNPQRRPYVVRYVPVEKKESTMVQYIIIPILLICIFVALVHPRTSKYLEKYLPKMKNMKGYLIRGLILAILYIAIKFITSSSGAPSLPPPPPNKK